jgi:hypothetical protein
MFSKANASFLCPFSAAISTQKCSGWEVRERRGTEELCVDLAVAEAPNIIPSAAYKQRRRPYLPLSELLTS